MENTSLPLWGRGSEFCISLPQSALRNEDNLLSNYEKLIEAARAIVMTDEEKRQQKISFAFGNVHLSNPNIIRADVEDVLEWLEGRKKNND